MWILGFCVCLFWVWIGLGFFAFYDLGKGDKTRDTSNYGSVSASSVPDKPLRTTLNNIINIHR